jgi:hypothetical protein
MDSALGLLPLECCGAPLSGGLLLLLLLLLLLALLLLLHLTRASRL